MPAEADFHGRPATPHHRPARFFEHARAGIRILHTEVRIPWTDIATAL
jgi:hypothetical protein